MSVIATPLRRRSGVGPVAGSVFAALLLLAALLAIGPALDLPNDQGGKGTPTIEDWRGNSASIRPAR